ncbi:MAG TPA: carboxymuconolactone decarboxylase family protein [Kofleriaceae bacterium]|nr:carboxymuconolactone decarboxylase family protein [Kofleriaceae bacterium]
MTADNPRISPGTLTDIGALNWMMCRVVSRLAGVPDAHLFSTLARQRGLFRGWLVFASRLMPGGRLSRYETELAILRVAHLRGCDYEYRHHVRLGRRVGIDDAILADIAAGPGAPGWSERHRALLAGIDALVATKTLDDPTWAALRAHYDERELIELCLLVGHYEMLATTISALRIAPDE